MFLSLTVNTVQFDEEISGHNNIERATSEKHLFDCNLQPGSSYISTEKKMSNEYFWFKNTISFSSIFHQSSIDESSSLIATFAI